MPSQNHGEERNNRNQETGIGVLTSDYWTGSLVPFSPRVRICASVTVAIEILLPPLLSLAQCPVPSARCPVRSVSRRRSVRSQVPSHAPSGVPTTTALSSAPGDCPAFQREKSLARNIPSGEKAGELASHPCRAPSQHQAGTPPRPPLQFQPFVPPGPVRPFHAPHPSLARCLAWPCRSSSPLTPASLPPFLLLLPLPARHRIPGIPLRLTTSSL